MPGYSLSRLGNFPVTGRNPDLPPMIANFAGIIWPSRQIRTLRVRALGLTGNEADNEPFGGHFKKAMERVYDRLSKVALHSVSSLTGEIFVKDLAWDDILSVGVDEIDDDHRKLVELFNMLNHSAAEGDNSDYLAALLEELISCTTWHFRHEERLMLKYGYDDLDSHKSDHEDLIQAAREFQQKVIKAGNRVAAEDIKYLERWLTEHILTADMRLGAYLSMEM